MNGTLGLVDSRRISDKAHLQDTKTVEHVMPRVPGQDQCISHEVRQGSGAWDGVVLQRCGKDVRGKHFIYDQTMTC